MPSFIRATVLPILLSATFPALAAPAADGVQVPDPTTRASIVPVQYGISHRPSEYSDGEGTNAANSEPVTPITPYGGYVVNQYGFGNYVSGPEGYGGYPAGSAGAQIWRQREEWKCQNAPETC